MVNSGYYLDDVLGANPEKDALYRVGAIRSARVEGGDVLFRIALVKQRQKPGKRPGHLEDTAAVRSGFLRLRFYGGEVVRLLFSSAPRRFRENSPMLEWDRPLKRIPCRPQKKAGRWTVSDGERVRFRAEADHFAPAVLPDGKVEVRFQGGDRFFAGFWDALSALLLIRKKGTTTWGISLKAGHDEHFCGTGERFDRMDLFGRRIELVNDDALGVNNVRAYKNIPLLISSRRYGLFAHSSAKMKLDIGRHSKKTVQWLAEDDELDLFFIGGGNLRKILLNYRRITGFPRMPPVWSFGTWMSRMTYHSDEQVSAVAERLRKEKYPADVLHLDTGWFAQNWKCDWEFSRERFPDPPAFFRRLRKKGFRVSLWQFPYIRRDVGLWKTAVKKGYVGRPADSSSAVLWGGTLDFTNPAAVAWYQGMLSRVLRLGASAIKADFGENVDEKARYRKIAGAKYRNLFSLLYQRAVWEITEKVKDEPVIWARAGWAGSQRYPVHWGGDSAATFDGLAGSLCGGLHLGLSGFAFWSHDTGGFYGVPDDPPAEELYLRWTQVGTFSSHLRFHGTTPREPWEFPRVSRMVREWLKFRYALLPYIIAEARKCCRSGLPLLRALVIEWTDDPAVWGISDEYLFGDAFLVCPVLNPSGVRDVYLPEGRWVDFWSGGVLSGPVRLKRIKSPPARIPLFVRENARVKFAEPVQCTDELAGAGKFSLTFDRNYRGFERCRLKALVRI